MFLLLGLLVAAPVMLLADWLKFFKFLPPREQNLARASHGAGLLVFAALFLVEIVRVQGLGPFIRGLATIPSDPGLWVPALLWSVSVVWGFVWLLVGARRARGPRDVLLTTRAAGKAVGGVIAFSIAQGGFVPSVWWGGFLLEMVLFLGGIWCMVTGAVKFTLLMIGTGGDAEQAVRQSIEAKSAPLQPARRRDF